MRPIYTPFTPCDPNTRLIDRQLIHHATNNNGNDKDYGSEDLEEDLIIQAAVTSAIAATLAVLDYTQTYYDKHQETPKIP